jgi:hypothetical protein
MVVLLASVVCRTLVAWAAVAVAMPGCQAPMTVSRMFASVAQSAQTLAACWAARAALAARRPAACWATRATMVARRLAV